MNKNLTSTVYACSDSLRWVKDTSQVIIVDEQQGKTFTLQGVDAAIWSWLSLRYSYQKLIHLVAALLAVSDVDAEHTLRTTLHRWHTQGLLEVVVR